MDFYFELKKDDFLNFSKEFHENKKIFINYLKKDKFFPLYMTFFFFCVLFCFCYFFKPNIWIFLSSSILCLLVIYLSIIINCKYYAERVFNFYNTYFKKEFLFKISLNDENINIYSKTRVYSTHTSRILDIYDTQNYFALLIDTDASVDTIILPKKIFENTEVLTRLKNIVSNKSNNNLKLSIFSLGKYVSPIIGIIFVFVLSILIFHTTNPELGLQINSLPVITSVKEHSYAEELGFKTGDIIYKINEKYTFGVLPHVIGKELQKKELSINVYEPIYNSKEIKIPATNSSK